MKTTNFFLNLYQLQEKVLNYYIFKFSLSFKQFDGKERNN